MAQNNIGTGVTSLVPTFFNFFGGLRASRPTEHQSNKVV